MFKMKKIAFIVIILAVINLIYIGNCCSKDDIFSKYPLSLGSEEINHYFEAANKHYDNNNLTEALKELDKINNQTVYDPNLQLLMAILYAKNAQFDEAIKKYKSAISLNDQFIEAYNGLLSAYIVQKNYLEAIRACKKLLKFEASNSNVLCRLGNLYGLNKEYDRAIKTFEEVIASDASNIKALNGLGLAYFEMNDYNNALEYFKKALALDLNPKNYNNVGLCYVKKKQYKDALMNFNYAIRSEPRDIDYLYNLSLVNIELNHYQDAYYTLEKILGIDPQNEKALSLMLYLMGEIKNHNEELSEHIQNINSPLVYSYLDYDGTNKSAIIDIKKGNDYLILENDDIIDLPELENPYNKIIIPYECLFKTYDIANIKSGQQLKSSPKKIKAAPIASDKKVKKTVPKPEKTALKGEDTLIMSEKASVHKDKKQSYHQNAPGQKGISDNTNEKVLSNKEKTDNPIIKKQVKKEVIKTEPPEKIDKVDKTILDDNKQPEPKQESSLLGEKTKENSLQEIASVDNLASKGTLDNEEIQSPFKNLSKDDSETNKINTQIAMLEKLSIIKPDNVQVHYKLALNYYKNRDFLRSEEELIKVIELEPANKEAFSLLGMVYTKLQKFDKAKSIYDNILNSGEASSENYKQLGYIHYSMQEYDKAIENYTEALAQNDNDVMVRLLLALTYDKTGNYVEEIKHLNKILEIEPDNDSAIKGLAFAYLSINDVENAISSFEKLVMITPEQKEYYFYLQKLYMSQDKLDKAVKILEDYLKNEPADPDVFYSIANIYARKGETDLAINNYKRAIEIMPDNSVFHYSLGVAYIEKGNKELAKQEIEILKTLNPELSVDLTKLLD